MPILIEGLKSKDKNVRLNAARVLGQIGREARDAANALTAAQQDDNVSVREEAKRSLNLVQAK